MAGIYHSNARKDGWQRWGRRQGFYRGTGPGSTRRAKQSYTQTNASNTCGWLTQCVLLSNREYLAMTCAPISACAKMVLRAIRQERCMRGPKGPSPPRRTRTHTAPARAWSRSVVEDGLDAAILANEPDDHVKAAFRRQGRGQRTHEEINYSVAASARKISYSVWASWIRSL